MKMEPIEGSETSAFINQTPGNYPKGNLLYKNNDDKNKNKNKNKNNSAPFLPGSEFGRRKTKKEEKIG